VDDWKVGAVGSDPFIPESRGTDDALAPVPFTPLRILTVANHLGSRGGLERTQLVCCQGLAARGHRVDLAFGSNGDFSDSWSSFTGEQLRVGTTTPRFGAPFRSTWAVLTGVDGSRRLHPDIVYAFRTLDVPFAAAVSALTGAKLVFHLCLPLPATMPAWLRASFRRVDATLTVSTDTARRWQERGVNLGRVTTVPTSIDLEQYAPATPAERRETRRGLGIGDDEFFVLYAGRTGREKGVDTLVRAFAEMSRVVEGCRLVVVGPPSLLWSEEETVQFRVELATLARDSPVTFLPGRPGVIELLQAADVAVLPSRWPDPLPRGAIEPLACGVPVVASAVGGIPEILTGWLDRFLVEPDDPAALADRLAGLRHWRRDEPELGARCRLAAEQRLSLDDEVTLIENAMRQVLTGTG
jgi:glycosyltransferase involved in cell wall biosynthesis